MTGEEWSRLIASERAKRDAQYTPLQRWKDLQSLIAFAEANMPEHLRRNRPRVPKSLKPTLGTD